jgi:methanogenic corrinoid protein MtbC1
MDSTQTAFLNALLEIDKTTAKRLIAEAAKTEDRLKVIERLIIPALHKIGEDWETGETSLAQVYMSGSICEELVGKIVPSKNPEQSEEAKIGIVVLEDHHQLGKRIIYSALTAMGYNLLDFGTGLVVDDVVKKVEESNIKILLVSTLMLPAALRIKDLVQELKSKNIDTQVIVGGAPFKFDTQLWKEVGADHTGDSLADVIEIVENLSGGAR